MASAIMLSVAFIYWYVECLYAECRNADCQYARCHRAVHTGIYFIPMAMVGRHDTQHDDLQHNDTHNNKNKM